MPPINERRFQIKPLDLKGETWELSDDGYPMQKGSYIELALTVHEMNVKYYLI